MFLDINEIQYNKDIQGCGSYTLVPMLGILSIDQYLP